MAGRGEHSYELAQLLEKKIIVVVAHRCCLFCGRVRELGPERVGRILDGVVGGGLGAAADLVDDFAENSEQHADNRKREVYLGKQI